MSIDCSWLYNGLQKEKPSIILVDCREYEEYDANHIASAICVPSEVGITESGEEEFVDLTEIKNGFFKHPKHFECFEDREGKSMIVYNDNDHTMWIGHIISCMDVEGKVVNVQSLDDGFDHFFQTYPFLCTKDVDPSSLYSIPGYPFPIEIIPHSLYVSCSSQRLFVEHVENLKLTDIVQIGEIPEAPVGFDQVQFSKIEFELSRSGFGKFIDLINEKREKDKKILVFCKNSENLLALVMYYLIAKMKKTLRYVYNFVTKSYWQDGIRISPQYLQLLSELEKETLGSTSITGQEIQSGAIPEHSPSKLCTIC